MSTPFNHILKTKNELKFTVETVKVFFHSRVDHDVAILHSPEESFLALLVYQVLLVFTLDAKLSLGRSLDSHLGR